MNTPWRDVEEKDWRIALSHFFLGCLTNNSCFMLPIWPISPNGDLSLPFATDLYQCWVFAFRQVPSLIQLRIKKYKSEEIALQ